MLNRECLGTETGQIQCSVQLDLLDKEVQSKYLFSAVICAQFVLLTSWTHALTHTDTTNFIFMQFQSFLKWTKLEYVFDAYFKSGLEKVRRALNC